MSFPPGTEMFQFPGFASHAYGFSVRSPIAGRGCPIRRSSDQSLLAAPQGFSQRATSFIASWRQGIHQMPLLSSAPTSDNRTLAPHQVRDLAEKTDAAAAAGNNSSVNCKLQVPADRRPEPTIGKHTHAKRASCHRRKEEGRTRDLPAPAVPRRMPGSLRPCPHDGHLVTTSRCPRNTTPATGPNGPAMGADGVRLPRAAGQRPGPRRPRRPGRGSTDLVGLGRLERPTSRLSGVRSNQLSYRPERHPAGPERHTGAGQGRSPVTCHPPTFRSDGCLRRDVQTAAGDFLAIGQSRPTAWDRHRERHRPTF